MIEIRDSDKSDGRSGVVDSLYYGNFQVKSFLPKGPKIFGDPKKKVLATKSKNLGASWPQGFFSKVEPCLLLLS